jgi:hypothetical protein
MQNDTLLLFVEGDQDAQIISWILEAARYPLERISINPLGGKMNVSRFLKSLSPEIVNKERCAVLVDMDEKGSIPQAIQRTQEQLGNPSVNIFCAIPQIEAWLFADEETAIKNAQGEWERKIIRTLPLPEEIENPKKIAKMVFKSSITAWKFIKNIDITRACARSPSLRHFLTGLSKMLKNHPRAVLESVPRSLNREVFSGLIREVVPAETVMWRTANGNVFTAEQLRKEIEQGTDLGRQYATDVLRIARELLKGMAQRGESV